MQHPLKDTLEHPKSLRQVTLSFVRDGFIRKLSSRVRSHIKYSEYLFLLCRGRGEHGKIGERNTGIKRTGGAREAEEEIAGVRSSKRVGSEKRRGKLG